VKSYRGIFFCDVDGTVLPHGEKNVSPDFFSLVKKAQEKDFLFCISSGRFHEALFPLFAPVADDVIFSASNGCRVLYQGIELFQNHGIPSSLAGEIVTSLHSWGATSLVSTTKAIYLSAFSLDRERLARYLAKDYTKLFSDFSEVQAEVLQITSVCKEDTIQDIIAKSRQAWAPSLHVVNSGNSMFDICPTSKGESLTSISNHFSVPIAHTYAFGDDENDLPMLQAAGKGYVMGTAHHHMKRNEFEHCYDLIGTINGIIEAN